MKRVIAVAAWRIHPMIGTNAIKLVIMPNTLGAKDVRLAMEIANVTIWRTNAIVNNCHPLNMTINPPSSGIAKIASNAPVIPFAKLDHFIFHHIPLWVNTSTILYD